jgi:hypothetical protein
MVQRGIHARDQAAIDLTPISAVEYARDAAHFVIAPFVALPRQEEASVVHPAP